MTGNERQRGRLRLGVWTVTGALMLLPVLAIRGVDAAAWDLPGDVMFLAIFMAGVGAAFEVAARVPRRMAYRAAAGFALAAALLQTWINLGVGIIGNEGNPANLAYFAVVAVALVGAVLARFEPRGMSRSMLAAAAAQVLVFAGALIAGLGFTGPLTVFFTGLWLGSAWLFHKAGEHSAKACAAS